MQANRLRSTHAYQNGINLVLAEQVLQLQHLLPPSAPRTLAQLDLDHYQEQRDL